ncbi:MAG TPA: oligosaccharide flippase family protein [Solimonas sp.]
MTNPPSQPSSLRSQLLRAVRGSVLVRVGALGTSLLSSVALARALGADAYGVYAFVFAVVTVLALPSQVGIPTLVVRETAKNQAKAAWSELRGLWRWAFRAIFSTSLLVAGIASLVIFLLGDRVDVALRSTLLAGLVLVPLVALGNARGAALRGLRHIVAGQLPESVLRPGFQVLLVVACWGLWSRLSAPQAMWLHALAAALAFAIGAMMLWKHTPDAAQGATPDSTGARLWWRAALPLALIGGLQVVGNQSGVLLLGLFHAGPDVGLYKVAASAATLAAFGLQTANMILGPYVARLHATGDTAGLQKLASAGALCSGALTVPVFLVFLIGGDRIVSLLYGAEYVGARLPLMLLAAAQMVNALFGSVGLLLNMTGLERDAARWLSLSAIAQLLLGLALVPPFGMAGAAIATLVSTTLWNFAFWMTARRKLGVDGSVFAVRGFSARWFK